MSLQDQFSPLVEHRTTETDHAGCAIGRQLVYFERRVERVAGENRLQKAARLLQEGNQGVLGDEWKQACTGCGLDQRLEAMRQHAGQAASATIFHIVMDGVVIAAGSLKGGKQRVGHRAAREGEALAEAEIIEPALIGDHPM